VDDRSSLEFQVAHINQSVNIPISQSNFLMKLKKLRKKQDTKKIVFYCNGHTCSKSYKAAKKAGNDNVYAYDSGIFTWINTHPELSTLLDKSPADKTSIISKANYQARLLNYKKFVNASKQAKTIVLDIRDPTQKVIQLPLKSKSVRLDKLIKFVKNGAWKDRNILIYDAVGKQVRWLQYYLEKYGYENYSFLNKGIKGVVESQANAK